MNIGLYLHIVLIKNFLFFSIYTICTFTLRSAFRFNAQCYIWFCKLLALIFQEKDLAIFSKKLTEFCNCLSLSLDSSVLFWWRIVWALPVICGQGKKLRKFMSTVCTVLFECTIWSIVGKMRNVIDKCIYSILLYYRG